MNYDNYLCLTSLSKDKLMGSGCRPIAGLDLLLHAHDQEYLAHTCNFYVNNCK